VTFTVAGAPTTITAASPAGAVVGGGTYGQIFTVKLTDANGAATVLAPNEALKLSTADTHSTIESLAGSTITTLNPSDDSSGTYYFRVVGDSTTTTSAPLLTITGSGLVSSSVTTNIAQTNVAATTSTASAIALTSTTAYTTTLPTFTANYSTTAQSTGFTATIAAVTTAVNYLVTVTRADGKVYDTYFNSGLTTAPTFTIATPVTSSDTTYYTITTNSQTKTLSYKKAAAAAIAINGGSTVLATAGSKVTLQAQVTDNYANGLAYQAVAVTVSGRNTLSSTAVGVTDANGLISYSYTDAGTTGTADTVTFTSSITFF
jgi:hypothetical protein